MAPGPLRITTADASPSAACESTGSYGRRPPRRMTSYTVPAYSPTKTASMIAHVSRCTRRALARARAAATGAL